MIFDEKIEVKTGHDTELIEFINTIAKPLMMSFFKPKTDDDEEGTVWGY